MVSESACVGRRYSVYRTSAFWLARAGRGGLYTVVSGDSVVVSTGNDARRRQRCVSLDRADQCVICGHDGGGEKLLLGLRTVFTIFFYLISTDRGEPGSRRIAASNVSARSVNSALCGVDLLTSSTRAGPSNVSFVAGTKLWSAPLDLGSTCCSPPTCTIVCLPHERRLLNGCVGG